RRTDRSKCIRSSRSRYKVSCRSSFPKPSTPKTAAYGRIQTRRDSPRDSPLVAACTCEIELDNLRRLFRGRKELPLLDRIRAGLQEERMAADGARALDVAVGCDDDFNFDFAADAHALGEFRIARRNASLDFALAFVGARTLSKTRCCQ